MQTINIWDMATRADSLSTLITGALVVLFIAGKVGWDLFRDKRNKKEREQSNQAETEVSDDEESPNGDTIEILTGTYIDIIKKLRLEVNQLKSDV